MVGDFVIETVDCLVNRQTIESFCDRASCAILGLASLDSEAAPSFVCLSVGLVAEATGKEEYGA